MAMMGKWRLASKRHCVGLAVVNQGVHGTSIGLRSLHNICPGAYIGLASVGMRDISPCAQPKSFDARMLWLSVVRVVNRALQIVVLENALHPAMSSMARHLSYPHIAQKIYPFHAVLSMQTVGGVGVEPNAVRIAMAARSAECVQHLLEAVLLNKVCLLCECWR